MVNRMAMDELGLADKARRQPRRLIDLRSDKDAFCELARRQLIEPTDHYTKPFDGVLAVLLDTEVAFPLVVVDPPLVDTVKQTAYKIKIVAELSADAAAAIRRPTVY